MDNLLTPIEVAKLLNISTRTLAEYRLLQKGPPWVKLGTSKTSPIRYRLSDVEAWFVACSVAYDGGTP